MKWFWLILAIVILLFLVLCLLSRRPRPVRTEAPDLRTQPSSPRQGVPVAGDPRTNPDASGAAAYGSGVPAGSAPPAPSATAQSSAPADVAASPAVTSPTEPLPSYAAPSATLAPPAEPSSAETPGTTTQLPINDTAPVESAPVDLDDELADLEAAESPSDIPPAADADSQPDAEPEVEDGGFGWGSGKPLADGSAPSARNAGFAKADERDGAPISGYTPAPGAGDGPFGRGSAEPKEDGSAPSDAYKVKGNADSMLFHTIESPYFGRTRAEVWFTSEAAARSAGFTRWDEKGKPAAKLVEVPEGAYGPGSADPKEDGSAPSDAFTVKGNADSMRFHTIESPYYARTKAEVWFTDEDAARTAGFTKWNER